MSMWKTYNLGKVAEFYQPKTISKNDMFRHGKYLVFGANGLIGRYDKYNHEEPQVIVTCRGATCGSVSMTPSFAWITGNAMVAKPNASLVLKDYLFQLLRHEDLTKTVTGGAQPQITRKPLADYEVTIPPLPEQRKIAEILSSVDEDILATQKVIDQTERMKKGLMKDLFTKGIGHTKFKDSELGMIPESWKLVHLEDVTDFTNGKGHEKHISEDGKYVVINSKFISSDGNVIKRSDKAFLLLSKETVVMVMSDVPNGQALAKCFFVDQDKLYTLNQRICSFRFKNGLPRFYHFLLNRNGYFLNFNNGTGQTNLRKQQVLDCPIALPPEAEQQKIVDILMGINHKLTLWEGKKNSLETIKKGLMQDLLSSDVRVND